MRSTRILHPATWLLSPLALFGLAAAGCQHDAERPYDAEELQGLDEIQIDALLTDVNRGLEDFELAEALSATAVPPAAPSDRLPAEGEYALVETILFDAGQPCESPGLVPATVVHTGPDSYDRQFPADLMVPDSQCERVGASSFFRCSNLPTYPVLETIDFSDLGFDAELTVEEYATNAWDDWVTASETRVWRPATFTRTTCVGADCATLGLENCASINVNRYQLMD